MKFLPFLLILLFFISCTKESNLPNAFEVNVALDDFESSATITWGGFTSEEDVYYDIVLADSVIATAITNQSYTFTNLKLDETYSGQVIAINSEGKKSIGYFEFNTNAGDFRVVIDKLIFDLDQTKKSENIIAKLKWTKATGPYNLEPKYSVYLNGSTIVDNLKGNSYAVPSGLLAPATTYRVSVVADMPNNRIVRDIDFTTPSANEKNDLLFEVEPTYVGYTAINVAVKGLKKNLKNQVFVDGVLLKSNHYEDELLISNLPINSPHGEPHTIEFIMYNDAGTASQRSLFIEKKELRRLPDNDLVVTIFDINDKSARVYARNISKDPHYDEYFVGITAFDIELNGTHLGKYQCYYRSSGFPVLSGLTPGSTNKVRVYVNYQNPPIDTRYEPEISLVTEKEISFTTYDTPLTSELEAIVLNVTSTGFEFDWRINLSKLGIYDCTPSAQYSQGFILYLDGKEYKKFDIDQKPVKVTGLAPNTAYAAKLVHTSGRDWEPANLKKQETSFTITTK